MAGYQGRGFPDRGRGIRSVILLSGHARRSDVNTYCRFREAIDVLVSKVCIVPECVLGEYPKNVGIGYGRIEDQN